MIFATLVVQGLTLPRLIRLLDVHDDGEGEREELHARKAATQAAIEHLRGLEGGDGMRPDTLERMLGLYEFRHRRLAQRAATFHGRERDGDDEDLDERSRTYQAAVREVLDVQRRRVVALRDEGAISDDVMHALERELDLEDARLEI